MPPTFTLGLPRSYSVLRIAGRGPDSSLRYQTFLATIAALGHCYLGLIHLQVPSG